MITSCPKLFNSYTSAVAGGNLAAIVGNVANVTRRAKQKLRTIFRIKNLLIQELDKSRFYFVKE